jgi:hypothetical protein
MTKPKGDQGGDLYVVVPGGQRDEFTEEFTDENACYKQGFCYTECEHYNNDLEYAPIHKTGCNGKCNPIPVVEADNDMRDPDVGGGAPIQSSCPACLCED